MNVLGPSFTSRRLSFGPFEADLHSGELRKDGVKIRLQAQPFQLLVLLLERPGELVTREEICQKLWSADTFVDFDRSLGIAVNKIREVLDDSATQPRFVETLPRRGYRFLAEVIPVPEHPPTSSEAPVRLSSAEAPNDIHRRPWARLAVGVGICAIVLAAGLSTWYFLRPRPIRSIAVLPLANLSADPNQQFVADGVTDELITNLAQISSLRVISHTSAMSYAGTRKSATQIARELGVDALVEGSIVRSGDKVRITAQLIHAASDRHLWARSYEREFSDVLTVEGEVAREIAESISLRLTPQEQAQLSRSRAVNPEVALLYFKGSYFLSKLDAVRAKEVFTEAIHLDPNNAESWAGLADALHTMGAFGHEEAFSQAKEAAHKALELNNSQAQALMVLGIVSFLYDWNPTESEAYFRRSISANPNYATAHAFFASTLAHHGKFAEALQEIDLARTLDPVSVPTNSLAWHVYFSAHRYDDALRIIQSTIEVDPSFGPAHWRLVTSLEQKGEYQKAIAARLRGSLIQGKTQKEANREASEFSGALTSGGARGYWQHKLDIIPPNDRYGHLAARCYMRLGKPEEAMKALEKAYSMRDSYLIFWLPTSEEFDPLRTDPRFQKMLHGLGIS